MTGKRILVGRAPPAASARVRRDVTEGRRAVPALRCYEAVPPTVQKQLSEAWKPKVEED